MSKPMWFKTERDTPWLEAVPNRLGSTEVILNNACLPGQVILVKDPLASHGVYFAMHEFTYVTLTNPALDALDINLGKLLDRALRKMDAAKP
jgi:hypothetical protein